MCAQGFYHFSTSLLSCSICTGNLHLLLFFWHRKTFNSKPGKLEFSLCCCWFWSFRPCRCWEDDSGFFREPGEIRYREQITPVSLLIAAAWPGKTDWWRRLLKRQRKMSSVVIPAGRILSFYFNFPLSFFCLQPCCGKRAYWDGNDSVVLLFLWHAQQFL